MRQKNCLEDRFVTVLLLVLFLSGAAQAAWLPTEVPGLHYPRVAQFARVQGSVVVDVLLKEDGRVASVKVISGHPILAKAAKENVSLWKFQRQGETSGDGGVRVTFIFKLIGECRTQCYEDKFLFRYPYRVEVTAPLPQVQEARVGVKHASSDCPQEE